MSSSKPSSIRYSKSPPVPQTARSPRSPPLPHFDDPPAPQQYHEDEDPPFEVDAEADDDEIPYPEPGSEQTLLPPPNFNPFFTLIEDSTSAEHYHPYVHYVFADDDPVIVTAAAMRSLGLDDAQYLPQTGPEGHERHPQDDEDADQEHDQAHDPPAESPLPPPIPGAKERYIIVDVAADGHTIVDAQSLSSDWQITNTDVRTAPSFDEASPDSGYMLRVEGVEIPGKTKNKNKGEPGELKLKEAREKAQGDVFAALDGLVKGVDTSLEVAGKISGTREEDDEEVRESNRTVLEAGSATVQDKGKGRATETCDY